MRLQLLPRSRGSGGSQTVRSYFDFVADRQSVLNAIGWVGADLVTPLGWGTGEYQAITIAELLRDVQPALPSGRTPIYVCPECGDISCGAITVRIGREGNFITWSDFAHENGYAAARKIDAEVMSFDAREYRAAIAAIR